MLELHVWTIYHLRAHMFLKLLVCPLYEFRWRLSLAYAKVFLQSCRRFLIDMTFLMFWIQNNHKKGPFHNLFYCQIRLHFFLLLHKHQLILMRHFGRTYLHKNEDLLLSHKSYSLFICVDCLLRFGQLARNSEDELSSCRHKSQQLSCLTQ